MESIPHDLLDALHGLRSIHKEVSYLEFTLAELGAKVSRLMVFENAILASIVNALDETKEPPGAPMTPTKPFAPWHHVESQSAADGDGRDHNPHADESSTKTE